MNVKLKLIRLLVTIVSTVILTVFAFNMLMGYGKYEVNLDEKLRLRQLEQDQKDYDLFVESGNYNMRIANYKLAIEEFERALKIDDSDKSIIQKISFCKKQLE